MSRRRPHASAATLEPQAADANKCDKFRIPAHGGISVHGCGGEGPCGILDGASTLGKCAKPN